MDYEEFNKEYKKFDEWWREQPKYEDREKLEKDNVTSLGGLGKVIKFSDLDDKHSVNDDWLDFRAYNCTDMARDRDNRVNSPSHYTSGRVEVIEVIEDAVKDAPSPGKAVLQAQVIKYIMRMWLKDNPLEDAQKAEWYLKRLIDSLNSYSDR
jgi:hypothetical protein